MSETEPPPSPKPRWTAGSIALVTIGLLILIPSGLCTGFFGLAMLVSPSSGMLPMVLTIGGIPALIGLGLTMAGFKSRRKS